MEDFEEWVAARRGSHARTAYLLTGDVHLAEDLVQETLARVAQRWRRLARADALDAYTRTVMHHLAIDRWRRRRARPPEVLTDHHPELGGTGPDVERRLVLRYPVIPDHAAPDGYLLWTGPRSYAIQVSPALRPVGCSTWAYDVLRGAAHGGLGGRVFGEHDDWLSWHWRQVSIGVGAGLAVLLAMAVAGRLRRRRLRRLTVSDADG